MYEFADCINLAENKDELWVFCEHKTVRNVLTHQLFAVHEELCCTLGNNRLEGSLDRSAIVASGLRAAWWILWIIFWQGNKFLWSPQHPGCIWGPPSFKFMWHMGYSGCVKKAATLVCLVPRWTVELVDLVDPYFHLPLMASLYGTWLSTRKAMYSKYYHVIEMYEQWLCFRFSQGTVHLILSLQNSRLAPSSGWCNIKAMISFKHQFWLCCPVGLTGCLAVNNPLAPDFFFFNFSTFCI